MSDMAHYMLIQDANASTLQTFSIYFYSIYNKIAETYFWYVVLLMEFVLPLVEEHCIFWIAQLKP